jgi:hypothetical protein
MTDHSRFIGRGDPGIMGNDGVHLVVTGRKITPLSMQNRDRLGAPLLPTPNNTSRMPGTPKPSGIAILTTISISRCVIRWRCRPT